MTNKIKNFFQLFLLTIVLLIPIIIMNTDVNVQATNINNECTVIQVNDFVQSNCQHTIVNDNNIIVIQGVVIYTISK